MMETKNEVIRSPVGGTVLRRLLVCVGQFPVPSEAFIYNQVVDLLDRGIDVQLVAIRAPAPGGVSHGSVRRIREGATVLYAKGRTRKFSAAIETLGKLKLLMRTGRFTAFRLFQSHSDWLRLGEYANAVNIAHALLSLRLQFDAVLAHFGPVGLLVARAKAAGIFNAPMATFFHGYDTTRFVHERGPHAYDLLFSQSDLLVANSNFTRSLLLAQGAPAGRVEVISPGIDVSFFQNETSERDRGGAINFLAVGRCVEGKGQIHVLRSLARLKQRGSAAMLDVVGDGPLLGHLRRQADELGVAERVRFHGAVSQEEVRRLMRQSHAFVMPSVAETTGWREGLGLAIVEAQACGLPIVASRSGGIPEAMIDGVTGILVPEGDDERLAQAMYELELVEDKRLRMGRAGRQFALERFDQRALNSRLLSKLGCGTEQMPKG